MIAAGTCVKAEVQCPVGRTGTCPAWADTWFCVLMLVHLVEYHRILTYLFHVISKPKYKNAYMPCVPLKITTTDASDRIEKNIKGHPTKRSQ